MLMLLVNAPAYKIQEVYYDTPPYPRTGLAFLAASLREAGKGVEVLDCKFDLLNYDQAMDRIIEINPDIVGITAFTNEIIQAGELSRRVKKWKPEVVTVIGGVHVSCLPEDTMREFPHFDYGVLGEGEKTIIEFMEAVEAGQKCHDMCGVCKVMADGTFVKGPKRPVLPAKDIPRPAWDMFRPAESYILQTQRGCPYNCPFCANPNGRVVRDSTAVAAVDEIEWLVKMNPNLKRIMFGDEIFTVKRKRTEDLCNELIDRGLHKKIKWWCITHVRSMDFKLATLMKKSGCYLVGLGIESGDEERLKLIGKGTSPKIIMEATKGLKKAKLDFEAFFILGQPNETKKSAMETINFAVRVNPAHPVFGIMIPYPGTKIWEFANKGEMGYSLRSRNWNDFNKQLGAALHFEGISYKTLESLQVWGYIKVFIWNFRLIDFFKISWQFKTTCLAFVMRFFAQILTHKKQTDANFKMPDKDPSREKQFEKV